MVPTVHLNGTSRSELLAQVANALGAVTTAIDAVARANPNGRDYYPQGDGAIATACAEHASRLLRLSGVRDELRAIYEAIDAQEGRRS